MVKQLKYAVDCKSRYSRGKEDEYVRCILDKAQQGASSNPLGEDKFRVKRAIKALYELQAHSQAGATRQQIRSKAGFTSGGVGLYPWLPQYGGLPVVEKHNELYRIADRFYSSVGKVV